LTASPQQFTASAVRRSVATRSTLAWTSCRSPGGQHHRDVPDRGVPVAGGDVAAQRADRDEVGGAHLQRGRVEERTRAGEVVCAYWSIGVRITRSHVELQQPAEDHQEDADAEQRRAQEPPHGLPLIAQPADP
jgi:hypothetical protein